MKAGAVLGAVQETRRLRGCRAHVFVGLFRRFTQRHAHEDVGTAPGSLLRIVSLDGARRSIEARGVQAGRKARLCRGERFGPGRRIRTISRHDRARGRRDVGGLRAGHRVRAGRAPDQRRGPCRRDRRGDPFGRGFPGKREAERRPVGDVTAGRRGGAHAQSGPKRPEQGEDRRAIPPCRVRPSQGAFGSGERKARRERARGVHPLESRPAPLSMAGGRGPFHSHIRRRSPVRAARPDTVSPRILSGA